MTTNWEKEFDELIYAYNRGEFPGESWAADGQPLFAITGSMQKRLKRFLRRTLIEQHSGTHQIIDIRCPDCELIYRKQYRSTWRQMNRKKVKVYNHRYYLSVTKLKRASRRSGQEKEDRHD